MMKICSIAASFVPSKAANSIQVLKAAHALAGLGHDVTLFIPGNKSTAFKELSDHYGLTTRFRIEWIPEDLRFRRYDFAYKAVRAARKLSPDLIYTRVLQAAVLGVWSGYPTILEMHDRVTGRLAPWMFRRFARSKVPHRILTNSQALQDILKARFNLEATPSQLLVAPNGVELDRFRDLPGPTEARRALDLPEKFTVGYTGHFYAGRGIELMYTLARKMPEVQFLWVGGKPDDIARWQDRLLDDRVENVILTGFVDNAVLADYQAAAEVLVMPYGKHISGGGGGDSSDIASPMKMFEYMAAERAIITSDLPVIHEVLDEEMAVFCPPENPPAWERALRRLMENSGWRKELARNARAAVEAYTWKARAERALEGFISNEQ
jgi:glycosyltransferase involved in cell wall biosynthesis